MDCVCRSSCCHNHQHILISHYLISYLLKFHFSSDSTRLFNLVLVLLLLASKCTTHVHTNQHREKRGTKIGFILHKNIVKTWKHLHINLLKQGDNVLISQIVQNIDKKNHFREWFIPLFCIFIWTHHQSKCRVQHFTAFRRSSKHHDIFQTLVVSTASSVFLS